MEIIIQFLEQQKKANGLLDNNILPIVNENDAVTTDKLKIGDNDNLSAMVASAIDAEALYICSDIDGLFDANPKLKQNAKLIKDVYEINDEIKQMATGATSKMGTGGMTTKLQAAEKATSSGVDTFIINGFKGRSFDLLLNGENPGTHFHAFKKPLTEKAHWIRHTAQAQGELVVKDNYQLENNEQDELLLSKDLVDVNGKFGVGDVVLLKKSNGERLAKVQTNYSSCLLNFIAEHRNHELQQNIEQKEILSNTYIALKGK